MHIALHWKVGGSTGWEICGTQLAIAFLRLGHTVALPKGVAGQYLSPWDARLLHPLLSQPRRPADLDLYPLGNGLQPAMPETTGVGLAFVEDTASVAPGSTIPGRAVLGGSRWCASLLGANAGVFQQGVDHALFCSGPKPALLGAGPVVFSGGKLEWRKGQDIVIRAFVDLLRTHPDATLLTAWQNPWPQTVRGFPTLPQSTEPAALTAWLVSLGIPAANHVEIGRVPHHTMPYYLRCADVAVFPNRCEGGTNLVAMEALACGIPTILSDGTGHQDLAAYRLPGAPVAPNHGYAGTEGWVEVDPVALADAVRYVLTPSDFPVPLYRPGHPIHELTWERCARQILDGAGT